MILLLTACVATVEPPPPVILSISTTSGATALIRELSDAFSETSPHISFEITQANTTRSLTRLAAGEVDMAIISYLAPDVEAFQRAPIARDSLLIVAHPDNPVDGLTLSDLEGLYTGKIYNWRDLQGRSEDAQVVVRERGSGLKSVFEEEVTKGERITPNARIFPNGEAVSSYVAQNRQAIGYVSAADMSSALKTVSLEGASPAQENLVNGAYPLPYFLYIVTLPEPSSLVNEFVNYLGSPAGQALVEAHGMGRESR